MICSPALSHYASADEDTGESIQLYQWTETRTCVATAEPSQGLHNVVPVGSQLPLTSGSAARVIAAFAEITIDGATFSQDDVDAAKRAGYSWNPSKSVKRAWPPSPPPSWTPMANSPPCYPSPAPPTASSLLLIRNSARSSLKLPESSARRSKSERATAPSIAKDISRLSPSKGCTRSVETLLYRRFLFVANRYAPRA